MSRFITRSHGWVLAALVLGALVVGARALLAMPANLSCPNPPNNGGTCVDQAECATNCALLFPEFVMARCVGEGCCQCLL